MQVEGVVALFLWRDRDGFLPRLHGSCLPLQPYSVAIVLGSMWGAEKRAGMTLVRWPPPVLETQTRKVGLAACHCVTGPGLPLSGSSSEKGWLRVLGSARCLQNHFYF